ncbi:hypothetical protein PVAP13_7NG216000 [Panicum virgatum]|uniref:Uncharacterized protein n=1 Tax=Panicum virgatum TaxID=38727 RepID=A0A8T0Q3B7_PANVG|nr:hypothetical protein PVAP13_7NG216000 [Panicum virgatum]
MPALTTSLRVAAGYVRGMTPSGLATSPNKKVAVAEPVHVRPPRQSRATDGAATEKAVVTGRPGDWARCSRVELTGAGSPSAPVRQVLSAFSGLVVELLHDGAFSMPRPPNVWPALALNYAASVHPRPPAARRYRC